MRILGEPVNHREYDGLAANLRQPLDEVHRDIRPDLGRDVEGLQQPRRLQRLYLVAQEGGTRTHLVLNQCTIAWDVDVGVEAMQSLLDTLVPNRVGQEADLVLEIAVIGHKYARALEEQTAPKAPGGGQVTRLQAACQ